MINNLELLETKKKECFKEILKNYLLPPVSVTLLAIFLHSIFQVSISVNIGVIIGLWLGTLFRLLFDIKPSYVYSINKTNDTLSIHLINPLGKSSELKHSHDEIESMKINKKTIWRAFDKINLKLNGVVNKYNIVDPKLTNELLESQ